ncbi:hypothetical protein KY310_04120 [Candidatus Woesearchaeota archaeon]|nr:hypothetical protein [Candidatus Woesearchaeota archaeon]
MHADTRFTPVQELMHGELSVKVGSFELRFLYSGATISLNAETDIGAVEFNVYDMAVTRNPEIASKSTLLEVMLAQLGKSLKDEIKYRAQIRRRLSSQQTRFLYSKTKSGQDVITLYTPFPVEREKNEYSTSEIAGMTVCTLSPAKKPMCPNVVYLLHCEAIGGRPLVNDRFELGQELSGIAKKVNKVFANLEPFLVPEDFEDKP